MKSIKAIIYTSNTGYTKQYAHMLGQEIELPVYELKEAKSKLEKGAPVIYLGWIMAGGIKKYKDAAKNYKVEAVLAVGMATAENQESDLRGRNNIPKDIPLFELQGGFDMNRLKGISKLLMKMMKGTLEKQIQSKEVITAGDKDMLDLLNNGGSRVSLDNLSEVIDWYKNK